MADSGAVNELVASMTSELIYWRSHGNIGDDGTKCSMIYRVLERIRAADPNAYEPRVLSIGPYYHGAPSLLSMEKEKWLCLDYVLKQNYSRTLHDYLAAITAMDREARACYAEDNISMSSRMFVEMLLLDSCFILVCLNGLEGIRVAADAHKGYPQEQDVQSDISVVENESSKKGKETKLESIPTLSCRTNNDLVVHIEQNEDDVHPKSKQLNIEPCLGQNQENLDQGEQWYNSSAVYDLLLLENQIPFFVVTKIYELLVADDCITHISLTNNLAKFIEGVLLHLPSVIQDDNRPKDFEHLLHLCYMYFKPSHSTHHNGKMKREAGYILNLLCWGIKYLGINIYSRGKKEDPLANAYSQGTYSLKLMKRWRRAEEYHEAGVEFTERVFDQYNPHSLLDIEFKNGILYIPCLPIDDKSGTLFRNLLAFEQTCPTVGNDVASYVYFMSQLISVPDDVALLSRKGVIVRQLESDEEVSALFAKLFEYVAFDFSGEHYLKSLCQSLEVHYQNRVNRWMAWLWHKHFGNPWLGFTALASVLMVFCSIGQTILAYMSYVGY